MENVEKLSEMYHIMKFTNKLNETVFFIVQYVQSLVVCMTNKKIRKCRIYTFSNLFCPSLLFFSAFFIKNLVNENLSYSVLANSGTFYSKKDGTEMEWCDG